MGKKRIVKKQGGDKSATKGSAGKTFTTKKKVATGILHVQSTYNNTKLTLTDSKGGALTRSSSGALGFRGAKKATPFASAKVGEEVGDRAKAFGMKEVAVVIKGVGPGRESAVRGFVGKGITLSGIRDVTPVPHNGPRAKKPRRV